MKCTYCAKRIRFWQRAVYLSTRPEVNKAIHDGCGNELCKTRIGRMVINCQFGNYQNRVKFSVIPSIRRVYGVGLVFSFLGRQGSGYTVSEAIGDWHERGFNQSTKSVDK